MNHLLVLSLEAYFTGLPRALEIMENLENQEKSSMHGKNHGIRKSLNNHGNNEIL